MKKKRTLHKENIINFRRKVDELKIKKKSEGKQILINELFNTNFINKD